MTDRFKGVVVAFDHDIRDDDAEQLLAAIRQLRGVADVRPAPADLLEEVVSTETAESVYMRQRATIADAIEKLQGILDNTLFASNYEITWVDVGHNAHIVDAIAKFNESVGS